MDKRTKLEVTKVLVCALLLCLLSSCRISMPGVDTQNPNYHYTTAPKTNALAPVNLLPAVSTRAVSHAPPAPVTNLVVTWETPGDFTPFLTVRGQTNSRTLVTWVEERNGGSWYQRTPANAPQATNAAVIANTNRAGMLRAAWGWK